MRSTHLPVSRAPASLNPIVLMRASRTRAGGWRSATRLRFDRAVARSHPCGRSSGSPRAPSGSALSVSLLLLLPMLAPGAYAAELRSVTLDKQEDRYVATSEIWLDAELDRVYRVLSDWDLSTRFSSLIVASRNIEKDAEGRPGFYMQNQGCVLFFCKTVTREGYVESVTNEMIRAVANPEKSDFEFSDEHWYFSTEGTGTLIRYELDMKPRFWIPPVIGPYAIKRKIRKDGLEALQRVEDYVNEEARRAE